MAVTWALDHSRVVEVTSSVLSEKKVHESRNVCASEALYVRRGCRSDVSAEQCVDDQKEVVILPLDRKSTEVPHWNCRSMRGWTCTLEFIFLGFSHVIT